MEADPLHMAAPKAHFLKDIFMDKDTPVFATSISRIRSYSNSGINKLDWKDESAKVQLPVSTAWDKRASMMPKMFCWLSFWK